MATLRSRPLPSRTTPRLSEPQLRKVVTEVLDSPPLAGFFAGAAIAGLDRAAVQGSAMKKLRHLVKPAAVTASKPSTSARIRALEKQLARAGNPVEVAELQRKLAFLRLEARGAR